MAGRQPPLDTAVEEIVQIEAKLLIGRVTTGVVQLGDLQQWGRMGALEARRRFDPRAGVHFKDFARHRIRGSMFDGLRTMGLLSRRTYKRLQQEAIDEGLVGEPTPDPEGGPTRESDARVAFQAILELATSRLAAMGETQESPEADYEERDAIHKVRRALEMLSDDERRVVRAVYDLNDSGDSGARMAKRTGMSRSSISRRHRVVLDRLRRLLRVI